MSSERDTCLRKADDAKTARGASNGTVHPYEKVAEHWMLLARLESLLGDEKNSEDA
jgi:hypothetical protein